MNATAPPARLKTRYLDEIRPALIERFGYSSVMEAPKLEKITLNMGVGMAKQDSKVLKAATEQLSTIAGQRPSVRRARKSIAAFKLREGMPVGLAATLRAERSYEFLDRLVSIAIPRIRDFRGLNPRSFDGRGNYSLGVREQIIFPEIDYDSVDEVRGLDITITTTAATDAEAFALLSALGMPFAAQGRPRGFDPAGEQQAAEQSDEPAAEAPVAVEAEVEVEVEAEVQAEEEPQAEVEVEAEVQAEEEPQAEAEAKTGAEQGGEDGAAAVADAPAAEEEPQAESVSDGDPEASAADAGDAKDAEPGEKADQEESD
jgi:large subunit ribosomal protein L5